jgi:hypothetical protein
MTQLLIPSPPAPGDLPEIPERPQPIRATPPPAASFWDELEEVRRKLGEVGERLKSVEDRLARLEGHTH